MIKKHKNVSTVLNYIEDLLAIPGYVSNFTYAFLVGILIGLGILQQN